MIAFKATKKRSISACLPAAVLLLLAHTAYGQIRIGGITIPKPNRANPTKAENNLNLNPKILSDRLTLRTNRLQKPKTRRLRLCHKIRLVC